MNFLSLKYFLAIAEEGSVSAAARKLYITQQSLSEHLKKLETELGIPLVKRGKTLTLTVAGECLYEGSKELMTVYNNMLENINDITNKRRSKITIAIPTWSTPPYLTDLIWDYQRHYPEYTISVIKRQHTDIVHNMQGVDLYISYQPLSDALENHILINHDEYCVTFRRQLAEQVFGSHWDAVEEELIQTKNLGLLKQMPFCLLSDRYGQITEDLRLIFQEYDFSPVTGIRSESNEINAEFCAKGGGGLLAPESYVSHRFFGAVSQQTEGLLSYPIRVNSFAPKLAISYEKGKRLHAAEICFIKEAAAYFLKR